MIRNKLWVLAAIGALHVGLLQISEAHAASLVSDPVLAVIDEIKLTVVGGEFDPVPGVDLESLHDELESLGREAVEESGLRMSASAPAYLSVRFRHEHHESQVAVFVALHVRIPGEPAEPIPVTYEPRSRSISIWSRETLDLVPVEEYVELIRFRIESALDGLVASRKSAMSRME